MIKTRNTPSSVGPSPLPSKFSDVGPLRLLYLAARAPEGDCKEGGEGGGGARSTGHAIWCTTSTARRTPYEYGASEQETVNLHLVLNVNHTLHGRSSCNAIKKITRKIVNNLPVCWSPWFEWYNFKERPRPTTDVHASHMEALESRTPDPGDLEKFHAGNS